MESNEQITEKDVIDMMHLVNKVPSLLLKQMVSRNSNVVKRFEGQINSYKNRLSDENIAKLEKVMEMPVSELQEILKRAYLETKKKQLKILADPTAQPFIEKNRQELKKVLFT
jgi:endonuclease III-like uncharacterized protein